MSNMTDDSQPLITHLVELRNRLLRCVICILVVFVALVYFSNDIYHFVAAPLTAVMPKGATMIATNIQTPFFTPIKLIWAFVAPALYQHEKRLIYPLLFSSTVLFYCGVAFAYYIVFPFVFSFFTQTAPEGVAIATDISSYLDFALALFLAFGVCFEVPVAIILLCWTGVTTTKALAAKRPYIIVGAFFVGMILTPPDVFSQTLLAVPMCLLFELGLLVARFYQPKEDEEEAVDEESAVENQGDLNHKD